MDVSLFEIMGGNGKKKADSLLPWKCSETMQVFQKYHLPCYIVGYRDTEWVQLVIVWEKSSRLLFLSACVRLNWKPRAAVRLLGLFARQTAFALTVFLGKAEPLRREKTFPSTAWKAHCNIKPQLSEAILCLIRSECWESINSHWHVPLICFRSTGLSCPLWLGGPQYSMDILLEWCI